MRQVIRYGVAVLASLAQAATAVAPGSGGGGDQGTSGGTR